jgi:hypothetical protein
MKSSFLQLNYAEKRMKYPLPNEFQHLISVCFLNYMKKFNQISIKSPDSTLLVFSLHFFFFFQAAMFNLIRCQLNVSYHQLKIENWKMFVSKAARFFN